MKFTSKTYDILKWVCLIVIPAVSVFYTTVGKLWGLPYLEEIPGSLSAIALFIGALIGVSTAQYNKNNYFDTFPEIDDDEEAE